jgi:hypothetical protein
MRSALAVYDSQIAQSRAMSELADASALLWRLQLRDIGVGERWSRLADLWDAQIFTGARQFYIVHAMMAFAAADRPAGVQRIFDLLRQAEASGVLASHPEDALTAPFCKALLSFARADYAACVEWLKGVRHIAHQCGGSHAQCDIIQLTFVEAALRANKANLARALVAERRAQNPSSLLNRRLQRRLARRGNRVSQALEPFPLLGPKLPKSSERVRPLRPDTSDLNLFCCERVAELDSKVPDGTLNFRVAQ